MNQEERDYYFGTDELEQQKERGKCETFLDSLFLFCGCDYNDPKKNVKLTVLVVCVCFVICFIIFFIFMIKYNVMGFLLRHEQQ